MCHDAFTANYVSFLFPKQESQNKIVSAVTKNHMDQSSQ